MYDSFYISHGGIIPVKWTAPEVGLPFVATQPLITVLLIYVGSTL